MIDELFNETAIPIRLYVGKEEVQDPYEKNTETTLLSPIPCKAICTEISPAKASYTMVGIVSDKIRQIILEKKYRPLILQSQKITIKGDDSIYYGYRVNGKLSIIEEQGYIRCYIYVKKES